MERAKGLVEKPASSGGGKSPMDVIYAERTLKLATYPETLPIPVQAFRVGDMGITGIPCETFVETGLELKARSPLKPAFTPSLPMATTATCQLQSTTNAATMKPGWAPTAWRCRHP